MQQVSTRITQVWPTSLHGGGVGAGVGGDGGGVGGGGDGGGGGQKFDPNCWHVWKNPPPVHAKK